MSSKEQLYYLLINYYRGNYDTRSFCEQFVLIYSDGIDDYVDSNEMAMMNDFCKLAERYSPYDEDLNLSKFFINDNQFKIIFNELWIRYDLSNTINSPE